MTKVRWISQKCILFTLSMIIPHPNVLVFGQGFMAPANSFGQCVGTHVDVSRLQNLEDQDFSSLVPGQSDSSEEYGPQADTGLSGDTNTSSNRNFAVRSISQVVPKDDASNCLAERHRMREQIEGVPIFGADFVVNTAACTDFSSIERSSLLNTNTLATMDASFVRSIDGYRMTNVNVPTGYTPKLSKSEATSILSIHFGVSVGKVTEVKVEIYPTEARDYRAWIATVLVDTTPGDPHVYYVVMDDDDDNQIILQCDIAGFASAKQQEKIRKRRAVQDRQRESKSLCDSCATYELGIFWNYDEVVECDVQTLYLNNEGRKSLCIKGVDNQGNVYYGPGRISQYFWNGTYNCNSISSCEFSPIPDCPDALNDVHFGAVNFMKYMQENLGVMGGLSKDANNPIPIAGKAHFDWQYCNAFYVPGEHTVYFGNCDCELLTPLVSTDVVVHEITHGLTYVSSNLLYFGQSGGLNEAYSDIMACAMEFTINDVNDTPDFLVGEALAEKALRSMEFPSAQDEKSIDDYCMFEGFMNVHFTSGFLNKAFVNAVRSCETTCGGATTAECATLMANIFMYTNMESLCMLSGFKDAAKNTCRDVEEFFVARSPSTNCSVNEARSAVIAGFASVGLRVNENNCRVRVSCKKDNIFVRIFKTCENIWSLIGMITGM